MAERSIKISAAFNLLKPTRKPLSGIEKIYNWALSFGRYLIIGTEVVVLSAFGARFKLDYDISDLTDSIEQRAQILANSDEEEERYREILSKTTVYSEVEEKKSNIGEELTHIEALAQNKVDIVSWSYRSDELTLSGTADLLANLTVFEAELEKETAEYHVQHPMEAVPARYESMTVRKAQTGTQVESNPFTIKLTLPSNE